MIQFATFSKCQFKLKSSEKYLEQRMKSRKSGHDQQTLFFAFACFTTIAKTLFVVIKLYLPPILRFSWYFLIFYDPKT